jgi:hypothetical protein
MIPADSKPLPHRMCRSQQVMSLVLWPVERRSTLIIAVGLMAFPIAWMVLVVGRGTYFGPMRGLFRKITRRYFDTLPSGWALFDVLFYLLPAPAFAPIAIGLSTREGVNARYVLGGGLVSVLIVVVIRSWSPGYL